MRDAHRFASERSAFTLVELLVVIGIIALLISILLPALTAARRQAVAVKCAAQLRELGHAFQMYAAENKGWYPPSQLSPGGGFKYNIDGVDYPTSASGRTYNAMWFNFIAKYVTKNKAGGAVANSQEAAAQRGTNIWGCPAWEGYQLSNQVGGISVVQTGYGMNGWPTMDNDNPPITAPPGNALPPRSEMDFISPWTPTSETGSFSKQVVWGRRGAERCLLADCAFWLIESEYVSPITGMAGQGNLTNGNATFFVPGSTTIDAYRHGKYPPQINPGQFSPKGGKVSFNILYVDGHVTNSVDRTDAFRSTRMRYPK
jgi:prepilin-type N-terminal cleavage/methylation domain-containing protein/prepilin-type processing-associated H-X9-DG protein